MYDAAGRLRARQITLGAGVEGITAEGFNYDGLGRLTSMQSGSVLTEHSYDSLSRLLSDTTDGKTVGYERDAVGNPRVLAYPSALTLEQQVDALDRMKAVGVPGEPAGIAAYSFRGTDLLATKLLGNGVAGRFEYDPTRRLLSSSFESAGGQVMRESLSWSPASLKVAQGRGDLGGQGWVLGLDVANRLTEAAWVPQPRALVPNNTQPPPAVVATLPTGSSYVYDAAENLVAGTRRVEGVATAAASLPPDVRNRPSSLGGQPLVYDAAGNLIEKGDLRFRYDYRNRLVRVEREGGEVARYDYDGFDRRVYRTVGGQERRTVWSGWQPVEEYAGGALRSRRAYGAGLDEILRLEIDVDLDGELDGPFYPTYDSTGNLAVLTDATGKPVERYLYTPYGPDGVEVDDVPPQLTQARVRSQELVLEFGEAITEEALRRGLQSGAIRLEVDGEELEPPAEVLGPEPGSPLVGGPSPSTAPAVRAMAGESGSGEFTIRQPVGEGRRARKRLEIGFVEPPEPGAAVVLTLGTEAVADRFQNRPAAAIVVSVSWPGGDAVLSDTTRPEVEKVVVVEGRVEIELTEEPDLASAQGAIAVAGQSLTWEPCRDDYGVCSVERLPAGSYELVIGVGLVDLGGNAVVVPPPATEMRVALVLGSEGGQVAFERPDARRRERSAVVQSFGWHGLERDGETGLIYARHRYYDPEMGRFISADPLGYVDGPSMYAFGLNNPVDFSDPMGLQAREDCGTMLNAQAAAICRQASRAQAARAAEIALNPPEFGPGFFMTRYQAMVGQAANGRNGFGDRLGWGGAALLWAAPALAEEIGRGLLNTPHDLAASVKEGARCRHVSATILGLGIESMSSEFARLQGLKGCSQVLGPGIAAMPFGPTRNLALTARESRAIQEFFDDRIDSIHITTRYRAGIAQRPQHHVFPQETEEWFAARGIDVHDFAITLDEAVHQAIHGGGNFRLGRMWEGEWNSFIMNRLTLFEQRLSRKLSPQEIEMVGLQALDDYGLLDDLVNQGGFQRYGGKW